MLSSTFRNSGRSVLPIPITYTGIFWIWNVSRTTPMVRESSRQLYSPPGELAQLPVSDVQMQEDLSRSGLQFGAPSVATMMVRATVRELARNSAASRMASEVG